MTLGLVDSALFRKTCARYATGIAVVALAGAGGQPYGLTVNSFTSVSLEPPLILVCIDLACTALARFAAGAPMTVNVLGAEQREISVQFARSCGDRFEGVAWRGGEAGAPILDGVLGVLETRITEVVPAGDHVIVLAEVLQAGYREGSPLIYFNSSYRVLS